ncbi:hypothetical protein GGTG_12391 [Gaeumannomyces tritici R3-111a-1]|uniref:Uncharacterized protein n=1 Tax=Gaeumannomyces tritici (strain R3-111a-1) TaxID=644352 RepID=J3PFW6_GAET3|nr:hypothetical protein GGTG_12391 [Gaeumannomyces tritici R3-111a-1]EJT70218.1 hypothetical protein GGTG_12391 [Gaeumannomyces tritici R3-111a-1]
MVCFSQLFTLLIATAAVASPVDIASSALEARQQGSMYVCRSGANNDGQAYGTVGMDKAIGYYRQAGIKAGASGYPKPFGNAGNVLKFASGCGSDVYELPLLASGSAYLYNQKKTGNPPGPIRVYYTSALKFCGIGAKENPNGSGNPHNCQLA